MSDKRQYGDGTRWWIYKGGGEYPQWVVRPSIAIHGFGTWWNFPSFESACAAFANGHTYRPPTVYP